MLEVKGISFGYSRDRPVFTDISFKVTSGSIVSVLGPSGIGKTTLALMLLGLKQPSAGEVLIDGRVPSKVRAALQLSYAPQRDALLPWLTARQNLRVADYRTEETKIESAFQSLGLGDKADCYPRQLSGGMRTRVNVARALVRDSLLTILDEPIAGLDERSKLVTLRFIASARQHSSGVTLVILHDILAAAMLSDYYMVFSRLNDTTTVRVWRNDLVAAKGRFAFDDVDAWREAMRLRRLLEAAGS